MRRAGVAVAGLALLLGAAGCGAPESTTRSVEQVAGRFLAAIERGDAASACSLLTPDAAGSLGSADRTCAEALGELDLPRGGSVGAAEVWSTEARVRTGVDTLFLSNLGAGWKVAAAGCTPRDRRPYDCEVR